MFELELRDYSEEGVATTGLAYTTNKPIIDLFLGVSPYEPRCQESDLIRYVDVLKKDLK